MTQYNENANYDTEFISKSAILHLTVAVFDGFITTGGSLDV